MHDTPVEWPDFLHQGNKKGIIDLIPMGWARMYTCKIWSLPSNFEEHQIIWKSQIFETNRLFLTFGVKIQCLYLGIRNLTRNQFKELSNNSQNGRISGIKATEKAICWFLVKLGRKHLVLDSHRVGANLQNFEVCSQILRNIKSFEKVKYLAQSIYFWPFASNIRASNFDVYNRRTHLWRKNCQTSNFDVGCLIWLWKSL